jgi:HK97 family phage portal protein
MAGKLQQWVYRNIWEPQAREFNGLVDIHGQSFLSLLQGDNLTDEPVTIKRALGIASVFTVINVRGLTISSLPLNLFEERNSKKEVISDDKTYYALAHEPNSYMSSANFWLTIMLHMDAWGNGFARINRDSRYVPVSFDIWNPWEVSISVEDGEVYYSRNGETVSGSEMLHFRWWTYDGLCGRSPILENVNTVGMALKLDRYQSMIIGSQPPGVLSYEGTLNPEQRAENKKTWAESRGVRILSGRWKYDPVMNAGDETQYIAARNNNKQEIYGIWKTPPTFAQNFERATYTNAEQSDLVYAKHTVTPLARIIEQELNMKTVQERQKSFRYWKFNMNGLLRGDLAARQAFYQAMVNTGIMNRNEARSLEDLNAYEGGEDFLVQGAMVPADMLRQHYENQTLPSVEPSKTKTNGYSHHYQ